MKKIQWIIFSMMLLVAVDAAAQKETKKEECAVFSVEIFCSNCVKNIKKNITYEKGVKNLKVDSEKQTVSVKYDPKKTDPEKLIEAFKKIGKEAKLIEKK